MSSRLGCYLLDVRGGGASGVELIGYGGYKFVGYVTANSCCSVQMSSFKHCISWPGQNHRYYPSFLPQLGQGILHGCLFLHILRQRILLGKAKT